MDDAEILSRVRALVDHEHELRAKVAKGELGAEDEQAQLRRAEEELDQCWDLLRQRRAHREFGQPVESSAARPVAEVEGYLQ